MDTMEEFDVFKVEDYFLGFKSFKGKDIKKWVKNNIHNSNLDIQNAAKYLNKKYYKTKESKPHDDQYYYFKRVGEMQFHLMRDKVMSPIINEFEPKNLSLGEFKRLLSQIRSVEKRIKKYKNRYDMATINNLNIKLDTRLVILMEGDQFSFKKYESLCRYKRMQVYNIFRDKLLDLQLLLFNIKAIYKKD